MIHTTRNIRHAGQIAVLGLMLAACGCGSGSDDEGIVVPPAVVPDLTTNYEAMLTRMSPPNVFNTAFLAPDNAIPTTGGATFTGFVNVNVSQAASPINLTGPATVAIDFDTRNLTGSATGFSGVEGTAVSAYSGTIDFRDGRIGRDESTPTAQQLNDIRLDYVGALDGDGNAVALDGSASGKLKGSPIRGLVANSASGETVTLNGAGTPASFTLVAEID